MIRAGRIAVVVAAAVAAVVCASAAALLLRERADVTIAGSVVDARGAPIAGAEVTSGGARTETDGSGHFELAAGRGWVTVRGEGRLPRTRAAAPGDPVTIRLAADGPGTVTFAFGGDVMFGRRFFDPDEDGDTGDGILPLDATAAQQRALLDGVAPLLRDADVSVVNMESPLADDPYPDPTAPRPSTFHPNKDYVFASLPSAAAALRESGVDIVDIGNNHLYDRLDAGVVSTRAALQRAGYEAGSGFFGAGGSPAAAWQPAERVVDGQRIVFLGCTSITGDEHDLTYVAGRGKGGAARCTPGRIRRAVAAAAARADVVVMMIHGGYEYVRAPSGQIKALSDAALAAGATMVIDHHPHVVGGLRFADGKLTAWTLGNLLFDQTVWPTFESYLLRVAVRDGRVVSAWLEPLRIQRFRPTGVVGADADWVAQGAFARSEGPWALEDGSLWLDEAGKVPARRCDRGAGRDLLWTGDFEDRDLDRDGGVALWNVEPGDPDRAAVAAAAYRGARGVRLRRTGANEDAVLLTPLHRILVEPGQALTFVLHHRAVQGPADGTLQLSWYNDTKGASQERSVVALPRERDWHATRVDVRVPPNAVAVQPFIRLAPPDLSRAAMDVDDVRLIDREEPGCGVPGGETLPPRATPLSPPRPLPPGPEALGE